MSHFLGRAPFRGFILAFCLMLSCEANATPTIALPTPTPQPLAVATIPSPTGVATSTVALTLMPTLTATDIPAPTWTATGVATATARPPTTTPPTVQSTRTAKVPPTQVPSPPPLAFHATDLVSIPQGVLTMGTPKGEQGDPDEKPQHGVTVYPYAIERFEVTNAQYQACVAARACAAPTSSGSFTRPSYFGDPAFAVYPVINVTWFDAEAYCKWLGLRLPNEAEWERAARGMDNWRFSFTNKLGMPFEWNAIYHGSPISFCEASCPLQNFWGTVNDGFADTAPVGSFGYDSSKGFGVQDMAGNVSEWVSNWYDPNAYRDGNDQYGPSSPTGVKVYRGGSWADPPTRSADRNSLPPDQSSDRVGFRCAK